MSIVGFTLTRGLTPGRERSALMAQRRALRHFPALVTESLPMGMSTVTIWGHRGLRERLCWMADGTTSVLVGSPHEVIGWERSVQSLFGGNNCREPAFPWDGRTVVLRIVEGGTRWEMWTDWVGSIPVYYAQLDDGWIASTLEPAVVAAGGFSGADISLPALLGELIDGYFLNDSTLFTSMRIVPPDCHATWHGNRVAFRHLWTVTPSSERWERGWNDLVDEMHDVSRATIRAAVGTRPRWVLPLSSGLDSRLIAAVAAKLGAELRAYTWGDTSAIDVMQGRQVAKRLDLPWNHVQVGTQYLATQIEPWTDIFGSSMHLHGMYQLEFYYRLRADPEDPVISGYLGDVLSGFANDELVEASSRLHNRQLLTDGYLHWPADEAVNLLKLPAREALRAIREEIGETLKALPGAFFQKVVLLNIWNRQRRFTGFSATVADYERGVATPYMTRAHADFCLSLPRAALSGRRLLADVFRRYYPALAAIPGSYAPEPLLLTGRYLLRRRLARWMPPALTGKRLNEVRAWMDLECVRAQGWKAFWPIPATWEALDRWVDLTKVSRVAEAAFAGRADIRAVRKLQSLQCLAYRLAEPDTATAGADTS